LLLPGNGTNGAQNNTFLDSSTNNFTITRNGDTTQGTFSPFSPTGWGNYFDGSGDYLTLSYSTSAFDWWTGDYTLEAWVYPESFDGFYYSTNFPCFIGNMDPTATSNPDNRWTFGILADGMVRFYYYNGSGNFVSSASGAAKLNQWNHIAMTKTSSGISIFVNGVGTSPVAVSGTPQSTTSQPLLIGGCAASATRIKGYTSNLRIVKGTAVYSGTTYTVPTAPLTAITNTTLLTCQSNRFIDNSASPLTITVNGNPSIQAFSPFQPTSAWSASTNGGSGYFDGSGDTLSAPSGASISGTGDFQVSCWIYPTVVPSTYQVIVCGDTSGSLAAFILNGTSGLAGAPSGTISYGRTLITPEGNTSNTVNWNAWNHLVISRVSGTLRIFINGVQGYSAANTTNYVSSVVRIGADGGGTVLYYPGYIADVRYVQGAGVTSVTVPTSPLTAITNTSLLLNFTNAGIIDSTAKNDLVTVGNAQISTTQSKFGGASLYFDGTGDNVDAPSSQATTFGTGDFCIEWWMYPTGAGSSPIMFGLGPTGGGNNFNIHYNISSNGTIQVFIDALSGSAIMQSGVLSSSVWTHVAVTRNGSSFRLFINGTQAATYSNSGSVNSGYLRIGPGYVGYIDDFRITKGIARYTANFTPPTAAFPLK
jgi:hypothetical protein